MGTNIQALSAELHKKVAAGQIEAADLEQARVVAKGTGNIRDRVLFAKIKSALEQAETQESEQ